MKTKIFLTVMSFGIAALILLPKAGSYTSGPTDGLTGAPGENTCVGCHDTYSLNSGSGIDSIIFDNGLSSTYIPGNTYSISAMIQQGTATKFGFQLTVLKSSDNMTAGTLVLTDASRTKLFTDGGRSYIVHTSAGTTAPTAGINTWSFNWTAPSTNVGQVVFYLVTMTTNNNSSTSGDYVYTTSLTVNPNTTTDIAEKNAEVKSIKTLNGNLIVTTPDLNDGLCEVTVSDVAGKLVLSAHIQAQSNMLKIPVKKLQRGVYLFTIQSGENVFTIKEFID